MSVFTLRQGDYVRWNPALKQLINGASESLGFDLSNLFEDVDFKCHFRISSIQHNPTVDDIYKLECCLGCNSHILDDISGGTIHEIEEHLAEDALIFCDVSGIPEDNEIVKKPKAISISEEAHHILVLLDAGKLHGAGRAKRRAAKSYR